MEVWSYNDENNNNIIIIITGRVGSTDLNEKRRAVSKRNSIFKRYMRKNKVKMIVQTGASFQSGLLVLQVTMTDKHGEYQNCDTLHLKRLNQCALPRCSVEYIMVESWTSKKGCILFRGGRHKEFKAPIIGDSCDVIVSTWRRTMHSNQQNSTTRTRHLEFGIVCAIQVEQRSNPSKQDAEQRSSDDSLDGGTILTKNNLKQARCRRVLRSAFINAVLVQCGSTSMDDRVPNGLPFFRTDILLTCRGGLNELEQLQRTLSQESRRSVELREELL